MLPFRGGPLSRLPGPLRVAALLCWVCFPAAQIFAQCGTWIETGPEGGEARLLAASSEGTVYAGAFSGEIFRSSDEGRNWTRLPSSDFTGSPLFALLVDPRDPSLLYAGSFSSLSPIWKSKDAGLTWTPIGSGLPGYPESIESLALDPSNPLVLYAGFGAVGRYFGQGGLYRTQDGGESWQQTGLKSVGIQTLSVSPSNPEILYAAPVQLSPNTQSDPGLGIVKSEDGGQTWTSTQDPLTGGQPFFSIAIDPIDPQTVIAARPFDPGSGIYRTPDGGVTWKGVLSGNGIESLVIDPLEPFRVFAGSERGIFRSLDGGEHWSLPAGSPTLAIESLDVDPAGGKLYAGTSGPLPVFLSEDHGETWAGSSRGFVNTQIASLAVDPFEPAHIDAIVNDGRLVETLDAGATWHRLETGSLDLIGIAFDPSSPGVLFGFAGPVMGVHCTGLVRSDDAGRTWSAPGLTEMCVAALAFSKSSPGTIYAATGSGISKSLDGGLTWTTAFVVGPVTSVAIDPTDASRVYAVPALLPGILRSTDAGKTWVAINTGFPIGGDVFALQIDPSNPQILYATVPGTGVFKSEDGGSSWRSASYLPGPSPSVQDLVIDPVDPMRLFVFSDEGVFVSLDAGATWSLCNAGSPPSVTFLLRVDSAGLAVYAGTTGAGVFRMAIPVDRMTPIPASPPPRRVRTLSAH